MTVKYSNGELCETGGKTSSTIHVVCGTDETITKLETDPNSCSIEMTISSMAGCGKEIPYQGSKASIAAIVILVLFVTAAEHSSHIIL